MNRCSSQDIIHTSPGVLTETRNPRVVYMQGQTERDLIPDTCQKGYCLRQLARWRTIMKKQKVWFYGKLVYSDKTTWCHNTFLHY